jgi:hypothetical protein
LNQLFAEREGKARKKALPKRYWAVRQIAGPRAHKDQVFHCHDALEAARQFFCWHGLTGQTYRYRVRAVELPSDHPAAADAVECLHPRGVGERTLDAIQQEQFEDVEQMVKSGEAASTIA